MVNIDNAVTENAGNKSEQPGKTDKKKLTDKQRRFCEEYIIDFNATQAAIRAGYSKKTAQEIGSENLSKPIIQHCIQYSMDKMTEKAEIETKWILDNLKDIVNRAMKSHVLMGTKFSEGGIEDAPMEEAIEVFGEKVIAKVYGYDPKSALGSLALLGKYKKMFTDKVEHTNPDGNMGGTVVVLPGNGRVDSSELDKVSENNEKLND